MRIIKGDINGDGKINMEDEIIARIGALDEEHLTNNLFAAADINSDGNLNTIDLLLLRKHRTGVQIINEVVEYDGTVN